MPRYVDRLRYARDRLVEDRWFDWSRGVNTRTGGGHGNGNMPAFTSEVRWWHDFLTDRLPDFTAHTFVDIGAGKGKALLVWEEGNRAAAFRQPLLGIESDRQLVLTGRANLHRRRSRAVLYCHDGTHWPYRSVSGRLIVWFFNSFGQDRMHALLDALEPCDVWMVYGNPKHAGLMLERGWQLEGLRVGYHERTTAALLRWGHAR